MKSKLVLITPEQAEVYLAGNTGNRPIKKTRVETYASDMLAGRWMTTPQGIMITPNGRLIDGQHRLAAVVKSGVTVEMYVFEVDENVQAYIDNGGLRTPGDVMQIGGVHNANLCASMSRSLIIYEKTGISVLNGVTSTRDIQPMNSFTTAARTISRNEIVDFYSANSDLIDRLVSFGKNLYKHSNLRLMSPTEIGFLYFLFGETEAANEYLCRVYSGVGIMPNSPELVIRKLLEQRREKTKIISPSEMMQYFVKGFEAFKDGRSVTHFKLKK